MKFETVKKVTMAGMRPVATNSLMPFFRRASRHRRVEGGILPPPFGEWSSRVPSMSKKMALIIR